MLSVNIDAKSGGVAEVESEWATESTRLVKAITTVTKDRVSFKVGVLNFVVVA
jgi:hypothetical protein